MKKYESIAFSAFLRAVIFACQLAWGRYELPQKESFTVCASFLANYVSSLLLKIILSY